MTLIKFGPELLPVGETAGITEAEELPTPGHPYPLAGEATPQLDRNLLGLATEVRGADTADYRTYTVPAGQAIRLLARNGTRRSALVQNLDPAGTLWVRKSSDAQVNLGFGLLAGYALEISNKDELWGYASAAMLISVGEEYD